MKQSAYLGLLQAGTVSDQDGSHMRFLVAILFGALILGLGYTYSQENAAPIYLTAPVERGTVSTLVKANGTVEAVISVDVSSQLSGRIAEVFANFNDSVTAGQPCTTRSGDLFRTRQ